ncbi:MAG: glycosyltransferase family 9 protein, partial [Proteobacteria bacterium]|nr:glycosyltransferase family 9 protein [Pseudomonadota bacterium]
MQARIDKEKIKKILVVRNDNIGDFILTTPALEALRGAFPDAYIAVLVADYVKEAVIGNPFVDKVYSYEKAKHSSSGKLSAWLKQWRVLREIKAERFDLAIGIRGSFASSQGWLVYSSKAPIRVGHRPKKSGFMKSRYYNLFVDDPPKRRHESDKALDVVRVLGADVEEKRPTLHLSSQDKRQAESFFAEHAIDLKDKAKRVVCLHLATMPQWYRWWPVDYYVDIANSLMEMDGVELVLNWMPSDETYAMEVLKGLKRKPVTYVSTGVKSFAAFLSLT